MSMSYFDVGNVSNLSQQTAEYILLGLILSAWIISEHDTIVTWKSYEGLSTPGVREYA